MSKIRVTYFDFAGSRGEEVRLALTIAGVDFDDNRVSHDDFAQLKPGLPFGALPVLDMEGHPTLGQSNAILRLIGRQHGLHPDDPFEAARHDALMDATEDLRQRISPTMRMTDPAAKKAARAALSRDYIPQWAGHVDRQIGAGPFVAGDRPSVADIKLYIVDKWISSGAVDDIAPEIFDGSPKLKALAEAVMTLPAVVKWYGG
ncbi:MAG: glutathione S-transferase family protein [Albidovulum sp.]